MAAEIEIIDENEKAKEREKDDQTFHQMLEEIVAGLNKSGLDVELTRDGVKASSPYIFHQRGGGKLVKVNPLSLGSDSNLSYIVIDVHKKNAFDTIREIAKRYSESYNCLNKILIHTYF